MTAAPWFWSHLSLSLLVAALIVAAITRVGRSPQQTLKRPLVALAIGMSVSLLPLREVDLAGYLLAYSGELSFATLFYFFVYLFSRPTLVGARFRQKRDLTLSGHAVFSLRIEDRDWNGPRWVWAVAGLGLYVSALGGRGPDIYAWGFGLAGLWTALAISAALAITGRWLGAVLLLGIVWAWQLRLSGGANFWDYAIDPFIFLGSLAHLLLAIPAAVKSLSGVKRGCERTLTVKPVDEISAATG